MINQWFFLAVLAGIVWRSVDGRVISVTAGLAAGVVLVEVIKHVVWWIGKVQ
jgi:hypothetical protein